MASRKKKAKPKRDHSVLKERGDPSIAERERNVWELRKAGVSFRAIARQLGLSSPGVAHKAYATVLREIQAESHDIARDLVTRDLARADDMISQVWAMTQYRPDIPAELPVPRRVELEIEAFQARRDAIHTVLRVMERTHRMMGIERQAALGVFLQSPQPEDAPGSDGEPASAAFFEQVMAGLREKGLGPIIDANSTPVYTPPEPDDKR